MKITDLSIRRSLTVFTLMFMVVVLGTASYVGLPRESSPDIKIPFVMVIAPYLGASPADMENLVTRKLEQQLKGLSDMEEMTSFSGEGVSQVVLEFTTDVEMSDALQKVRDAVELAKPELPQDVKDDLIIQEISSSDWPIMQVVLSAEYDPLLLKDVAEDLQEELERIEGILDVGLSGVIEREVRVDVDPERLLYYGMSLNDIMDAIRFENINIPGGDLALGTYEYQLRVPGEFEKVEEIPRILLNLGEDTPIYLGDVAHVSFGIKDRETISRINGVEAVTLNITKRSGENIIRIADEIHAQLEVSQQNFPPGTKLNVTGDVSVYIRDMVTELENNILSGLILVVLVLFLFLGFTNSLFVASAIPFSMLISFMVLSAMGLTLNMVVLFSLILALGMLVDNAIVVVENIFRHRMEGMGRFEAAKVATDQVSAPVIASTITTICAFGPLIFWPGIMGEFMKYLPITVIITLLSSLFVALVFNPVLCANLMRLPKDKGDKKRLGDRLINMGLNTYDPVIRWALHHRAITLAGMVVLFFVVMVLFGMFNAGVELFPDIEPTYAYVRLEAPSGTRVEMSDTFSEQIEKDVAAVPELVAYVSDVGSAGGGGFVSSGGGSNLATVSMEFVKSDDRKLSSRESLADLRTTLHEFTGAKLTIDKQEEGPPTGKPVSIEIAGDDFATLGILASRVRERIRDIPGIVDLEDDFDQGRPEIRVKPDLEEAARLGLRTMDIASTLRAAIHGEEVSKFRVGEDEYEIMVRLAAPKRRSVEDLEDLTIFYEGRHIPLGSVAEISYEAGLGAISRIDSRRVVTVTADVAPGFNGNALLTEAQSRLEKFTMPTGYYINYAGESEDQEEANTFLFRQTFPIVLMLIMLVLITQFTSLTVPFVIMSSVLLSFIGVFTGLMVVRMPFGIIMTGVGVISLAGVVVNNAIVLLDYVIKLREEGRSKFDAIVEAGRTRFRPVILTAITTVLGLIPLTTGFSVNFGALFSGDFDHALRVGGESSQWWGPMGVAVIWGLTIATFLTLVVVPVMYSSIDPILRMLWRAFLDWPTRPFRRWRRLAYPAGIAPDNPATQ